MLTSEDKEYYGNLLNEFQAGNGRVANCAYHFIRAPGSGRVGDERDMDSSGEQWDDPSGKYVPGQTSPSPSNGVATLLHAPIIVWSRDRVPCHEAEHLRSIASALCLIESRGVQDSGCDRAVFSEVRVARDWQAHGGCT